VASGQDTITMSCKNSMQQLKQYSSPVVVVTCIVSVPAGLVALGCVPEELPKV